MITDFASHELQLLDSAELTAWIPFFDYRDFALRSVDQRVKVGLNPRPRKRQTAVRM